MSIDEMLLFLIINILSAVASITHKMCFESLAAEQQHVYDRAYSGDSHIMKCPHNGNNISWYFNGVPYKTAYKTGWGSNNHFHVIDDHLQTEEPPFLTPSHEGNYTCQVLTSDGCYINYTITLIVYGRQLAAVPPLIMDFSENVLTPLQRSVKLFCTARVGRRNINTPWTSTLKWYFFANGSIIELTNEDPTINITYNEELNQEKSGIIRSSLSIRKVSLKHYGMYTCIAHNQLGEVTKNITLKQGVPESERHTANLRWMISSNIILLVILLLSYVTWRRFKIPLKLYWSHRKRSTVNDKDSTCVYDVVVIHGSSSSDWVYRELLHRLEGDYGYTCFLPHRDCPAGEIMIESVCSALSMSRMVLVVVTKSLADEPGDKWMMLQGLAQALQEHTNTCAIIKEVMPGLGNLHDTLRSVRKIYYPATKPTRKSHHKNRRRKVDERSYRDAGNTTRRMASELYGSNEPTTPCSGTSTSPFLSTTTVLKKNNTQVVCSTLYDVWHVGWTSNPDVMFWCEVLLHLPRPLPSYHQKLSSRTEVI